LRNFLSITLYLLCIFCAHHAYASEIVTLNDTQEEYLLTDSTVDIFEDTSRLLTIEDIKARVENPFLWNRVTGPQVNNPNAVFWIKFTLKDLSSGKYHWLLEFFDNRLDEITVYFPDGKGGYKVLESGDTKSFHEKNFQHINYVFDMPSLANAQPTTIYVRLYANHEIYIYGLVRSVQRYVSYATTEYFYVSIFYGILLAMAIYNFLLMLSVKDKSYVYYILYVFSVGMYSFARDGFGYQFIWPNQPDFNVFVEPLALYGITVTLLMYAREFLNTKEMTPLLDKIIQAVVILRTLVLIIGAFVSTSFIRNIYFDIPLILLAYAAGFWSYRKGYKASRYYIIGFSVLFIGFCVDISEDLGFAVNILYAFYSFNVGVVIQLIVLSIALADRVKILIDEKEEIKDQVNRQLEEKVKERTLEIQDKNEQLDSFVYKASHDIKGPLRSLMGLTKVGLVDFKEIPKVVSYFEHILKTATRLDMVLEDLLVVTKIKNTKIQQQEIDFEAMVYEILETFNHLKGYEKIKLKLSAKGSLPLISDETILYSIIQNLIENVIKYQDEAKPESYLDISLNVSSKMATLIVEDNGAGISPSHLNHIFDMFYKINERSIGSGLGLYILRQAVQRLNGKVTVNSVLGQGSTFIVELPQ